MTEPAPPSLPRSPGQLALSIMGWVELGISLILFLLRVYVASAAFGLAALLLTFLATQIRRQRAEYLRRSGREGGSPGAGRVGPAFWVQLGAGAALVLASAVFLGLGNAAFAVNFLIWGLALGMLARRTAQRE